MIKAGAFFAGYKGAVVCASEGKEGQVICSIQMVIYSHSCPPPDSKGSAGEL